LQPTAAHLKPLFQVLAQRQTGSWPRNAGRQAPPLLLQPSHHSPPISRIDEPSSAIGQTKLSLPSSI